MQAWPSYNGQLQAQMSFNSTEICPQVANRMASSQGMAQIYVLRLPSSFCKPSNDSKLSEEISPNHMHLHTSLVYMFVTVIPAWAQG